VTLLAVVFVIGLFSKMLGDSTMPSKASVNSLKRLTVVNLSANQAGIYWQTDRRETGWVLYGETNMGMTKIAYDERDASNKKGSYLNHYVTLKNLLPGKTYYYSIIADNKLVNDQSKKPFSLKTVNGLYSSSNLKPAYGKIVKSNNLPLSDAAVLLTFKNSHPLFTLTKLTGEWLIPLNNVIEKDTGKIKSLEKNETGLIEIFSEDGEKTNVEFSFENLAPLPSTLIIGKDYQFVGNKDVLGESIVSQAPSVTLNPTDKGGVEIIYPKENAVIPDANPLIKGSALPNSEVFITIHSPVAYSFRVQADDQGIWRLNLSEKLSPGEHTIILTTKDRNGKEVTVSRKFAITKSGEQVLGVATGEATPTSLPTVPTTVTASPALTQAPTSGSNMLPLAITSGSLIILGLGIMLAF
jgi:hypothetical protein